LHFGLQGTGKVAVVEAPSPSLSLPNDILPASETRCGVPTGAGAGDTSVGVRQLTRWGKIESMTSRRWLQFVFKAAGPAVDKFAMPHA